MRTVTVGLFSLGLPSPYPSSSKLLLSYLVEYGWGKNCAHGDLKLCQKYFSARRPESVEIFSAYSAQARPAASGCQKPEKLEPRSRSNSLSSATTTTTIPVFVLILNHFHSLGLTTFNCLYLSH